VEPQALLDVESGGTVDRVQEVHLSGFKAKVTLERTAPEPDVVVGPDQLLFFPRREPAKWIGCPPQFCHGIAADHLALPFATMKSGPEAGLYRPHLTYHLPGGGKHRHWLMKATSERVAAAMQPIQEELVRLFLAARVEVTLEQLQAEGALVVLVKQKWLRETGRKLRATLRPIETKDCYDLTEELLKERFEGFRTAFRYVRPLALRDPQMGSLPDPLFVVRALEEEPTLYFLGHRGTGTRRRWLTMPFDYIKTDDMRRIIRRHMPTFEFTLFEILRELQVDCDAAELWRGRGGAGEASGQAAR
jgi:hypothetical protein